MNLNMQEIKARRAAITPGKWRKLPLTNHDYNVSWGIGGDKDTIFFAQGRCKEQNAEFIANAPSDIDALVKRVEDLEESHADELREIINRDTDKIKHVTELYVHAQQQIVKALYDLGFGTVQVVDAHTKAVNGLVSLTKRVEDLEAELNIAKALERVTRIASLEIENARLKQRIEYYETPIIKWE